MQKKIIALAIAGLASSAAFAQTNVTIYGSVDAGYTYRWDQENRVLGVNNAQGKTRSSIDSGNSAGNRLGFKGTEDLGNGLKAVFLLEQGFNFDAGQMGQSAATFGRQAYVGLTGGFGTAIAGRLYTPHFSFVSSLDPFAAGTVGQYRNVWGASGVNGAAQNLLDPVRVDNAVAYVSPNFGGFDVTLAYSNAATPDNGQAQENTGNNASNNTVYAVLAKYAAGPVVAGLNVHRIAAGSGFANTTVKTIDNYTFGASFDAKVVKIVGVAAYTDMAASGVATSGSFSNYLLGATVPVGKFAAKASVAYSDFNGERNNAFGGGQAVQYAIGADYALSKRTNFYTAYSMIDAQSRRSNSATIMGTADASNAGFSGTNVNPFQQGLTMGLRHQF